MINKQALLFAVALVPLTAGAQELDYTYVEASYLNTKIDLGPKISGDGLGLEGSASINEKIFIFGDYARANFDHGIDSSGYALGAGMHWPLRRKLDAYGEIGWVHQRVSTDFASDDDDGIGINVGLRSLVGAKVELQGAIDYVDLDSSETSLLLAGRYHLTDTVAVGVGYDINHDNGGWSVSLRAQFGK